MPSTIAVAALIVSAATAAPVRHRIAAPTTASATGQAALTEPPALAPKLAAGWVLVGDTPDGSRARRDHVNLKTIDFIRTTAGVTFQMGHPGARPQAECLTDTTEVSGFYSTCNTWAELDAAGRVKHSFSERYRAEKVKTDGLLHEAFPQISLFDYTRNVGITIYTEREEAYYMDRTALFKLFDLDLTTRLEMVSPDDHRVGYACLDAHGNPARSAADCLTDFTTPGRCTKVFNGQCGIIKRDAERICGEWAECGGVFCGSHYPGAGTDEHICLARTEAEMSVFELGNFGGTFSLIKRS